MSKLKVGSVWRYETATRGTPLVKIISIETVSQPMPNNGHLVVTVETLDSGHVFTTPARLLTPEGGEEVKKIQISHATHEVHPSAVSPGDHIYRITGEHAEDYYGVITHSARNPDGTRIWVSTKTTVTFLDLYQGMQTGKYKVLRSITSSIVENETSTSQPEAGATKAIPIKEAEQGDTVTIGNTRFTIIDVREAGATNYQRRYLLREVGTKSSKFLSERELEFLHAEVTRVEPAVPLPDKPGAVVRKGKHLYYVLIENEYGLFWAPFSTRGAGSLRPHKKFREREPVFEVLYEGDAR